MASCIPLKLAIWLRTISSCSCVSSIAASVQYPVAIEHFERPFTPEEEAELSRFIAEALQDMQPPIAIKGLHKQHLVNGIVYTALILLASLTLWILGIREWMWVVLAGLALLFYWWGYPGRIYTLNKSREILWESGRERRAQALDELNAAQAKGTLQGVRVTADALVSTNDDEYAQDFYRVGEDLWLFLELIESPWRTEMVLTWYGDQRIRLHSYSEEELKPIGQPGGPLEENSDNFIEDGDLFEMTLEELLSLQPMHKFVEARRGNIFTERD